MSKSAAILGLVAVASAAVPAGYGSSAAPAYSSAAASYDPSSAGAWSSSAAPAYSSSAAAYDPSSSGWSSAPAYPSASSSFVVSAYPSSSYSAIPSASPTPYPACWSKCFAEAGIQSESALCGNVQVDECVHDECSCEESWAYWQWYDSYCPAPSSSVYVVPSSTYPVGPASSSASYSSVPSSPIDSCWAACFAQNDVTSEAELCGDDAVSACIHDTCCAAEDKAYWMWYDGFCAAASTSVVTYTTAYTPIGTPVGPVTTTYVATQTYAWTPVAAPTGTTMPAPPASPVAPFSTYPAASGAAQPTGWASATGAAAPTASAWAPVPATGAGAVAKPGMLFAAVMAVAALF